MKHLFLSFFLVLTATFGFAQAPESWEPSKTSYVNDFAKAFTPDQAQNLDRIMRNFHDTVQITIVTVPTLNGLDRSEYAVRLGNKWGVGSHSNNGLLILICPAEHQFFAATGGGIQGDLTDLQAAHWFDVLAKPKYKENDMYGGTLDVLNKYVDVLSPSAKEFRAKQEQAEAEQKQKQTDEMIGYAGYVLGAILAIILIVYGIFLYRRKKAREAAELDEIKRNFKTAAESSRSTQIKIEKYAQTYKEAVTLKNTFYGLGLNNRQDVGWTKDQYLSYSKNYEKYCNDNRELTRQLDRLIADAEEKARQEREAALRKAQTISKAQDIVKRYCMVSGDKLVHSREIDQKFSKIIENVVSGLTGLIFNEDHRNFDADIAELRGYPDRIWNEVSNLSQTLKTDDEAAITKQISVVENLEDLFDQKVSHFNSIISDDAEKKHIAETAKDKLGAIITSYEGYIGKNGVSAKTNETTKAQCDKYRTRLNAFNGLSLLEMYGLYVILLPMLNDCRGAKGEHEAYLAEEKRKAELERQRLAAIQAEEDRKRREEEDRRRREREAAEAAAAALLTASVVSSSSSWNDNSSSSSWSDSSSSSFGGGSFDGGGGGGSW